MIIGLAGKVCSGKSSLATVFAERNLEILDADQLGHQALEELIPELIQHFGTDVVKAGKVDRRALAQKVFPHPQALKELEALVHPKILTAVQQKQKLSPEKHFVLQAAVLHKGGLAGECEAVVWVKAPWWQRLWRARKRDQRTWKEILSREWAQRSFSIKAFGKDVDTYIVDNGKGLERAQRDLATWLDRRISV